MAGNHPFQVVWLSEVEARRVSAAGRRLRRRSRACDTTPAIVFEGDQPADPAENQQLAASAGQRRSRERAAGGPKAWLGAAVAIKEPTFVSFARHAGSNLLVVGSEEESAFGVLANAVVALAAQGDCRASSCSTARGPIRRSPAPGSNLPTRCPRSVTVAGPRDTARAIAEIAAEVARREAASEEDAPPWYLVIHDAGRFRDLRRNEDDFSFSIGSRQAAATRTSNGPRSSAMARPGASIRSSGATRTTTSTGSSTGRRSASSSSACCSK